MEKNKLKIFVAISGGVDSAVSAALLKKEGYDVTGVFMKNWSGDDYGIQADCPWEEDQKSAEEVCKHLDIPFRSFNFEKQYREKVVEYFFEEFRKGRTPNPDVMCNKEIKFKLFLEKSLLEGADLIATGHYARRFEESPEMLKPEMSDISQLDLPKDNTQYHLYTGNDDIKNQVYFLYNLTREQLSRTIFPIGMYPKSKVRELAEKFNLPNKNRPDSQGICFIGEINVVQFLMSEIPEKKGEIIDIDTNEVVGEHKGIYFYTIGQRKGLGIGGNHPPYYVCGKDVDKNILYACQSFRHPTLFKNEVELEDIHWIAGEPKKLNDLQAVVRYQQKPQPGKFISSEKKLEFVFDVPQRAIASGQSLVMFEGEECLGGGVIK